MSCPRCDALPFLLVCPTGSCRALEVNGSKGMVDNDRKKLEFASTENVSGIVFWRKIKIKTSPWVYRSDDPTQNSTLMHLFDGLCIVLVPFGCLHSLSISHTTDTHVVTALFHVSHNFQRFSISRQISQRAHGGRKAQKSIILNRHFGIRVHRNDRGGCVRRGARPSHHILPTRAGTISSRQIITHRKKHVHELSVHNIGSLLSQVCFSIPRGRTESATFLLQHLAGRGC